MVTVLKLLLGKYGILSIEMQRAITFDQSLVKGDVEHIDEAEAIFIDNSSNESLASKLYDREEVEEQTIVVVEAEDEKEIHEYKVEQLKFKPRHKKENKVADKELAELEKLEKIEKKEGMSKLEDV